VRTLSHHTLGRYQIEAEIGRGAMGIVYRAFDPKIDRLVAIKTISLAAHRAALDGDYRERFLRETRAAGRLSHPGIVTIFDAGEDPESGDPYLVMEYVPGEALSKLLAEHGGRLPVETALTYAQEIAEALDYAHSQGVVHRDIKPANILISEDGHAKIADFGVAWINQEINESGEVVGSPAYMAPEQMMGKTPDARSDLFSLGVILYSMITGFRPFQGNSAQTVCFKVINTEPVPVTSFQHEATPELDRILSRAMAKDPYRRYPSGREMARDLARVRENDPTMVEATSFLTRVIEQGIHAADSRPSRERFTLGIQRALEATAVTALMAALLFAWHRTRAFEVPVRPPSIPAPTALAWMAAQPRAPVGERPSAKKAPPRKRPKSRLQPAAADTAATPAKVQFEIQHHFPSAKASIWLDDDLVFDQPINGIEQRHAFLRAVEINQLASFQFAPGKHWLQVRVIAPGVNYDQIETFQAELAPGSQHAVRVNCDKRKMLVTFR
jgi:serine/threonine-protein kinase